MPSYERGGGRGGEGERGREGGGREGREREGGKREREGGQGKEERKNYFIVHATFCLLIIIGRRCQRMAIMTLI